MTCGLRDNRPAAIRRVRCRLCGWSFQVEDPVQTAALHGRKALSRSPDKSLMIVVFRCVSTVSLAFVLVVAAVPDAGAQVARTYEQALVAPAWRAVEPLVHAPEGVQPARVRRVGVVDDAVLECEGAHARQLAGVRRDVRSEPGGDVGHGAVAGIQHRRHIHRPVVVFDDSGALRFLGNRRAEVVVEVARGRGRPRKRPAHPPLVGLQRRERSPRHRAERDVVIGEVDDGAVEAVRDRRAGRTPCLVLGPEHEVVDEELRTSSEEIGEERRALVGLEAVLLVDRNPGQLLPLARQFVATPRQRLLGLEQLHPGRKPLFTCSSLVIGHCFSPSCRYNSLAWPAPPMTSHIGGVSPGTDEGAITIRIPSPTIASASGTSMTAFAGRSFCGEPERRRQRGCRRGCPRLVMASRPSGLHSSSCLRSAGLLVETPAAIRSERPIRSNRRRCRYLCESERTVRCEDAVVTERTLIRARAGDEDAFRELTDPYRRELQLHCYRILGSLQDAEDLLQETLLAAWRALEDFEGRASLRSWLYRIATNRCLNALRDASRRPAQAPEPEATWLQPYPDALLDSIPDDAAGPEARYETREAVALAFVAGLQQLPPRQRAVLVLRDVLGYRTAEVADMLDATEASVTNALQRARASLDARLPAGNRERARLPSSERERRLVGRFADAFEGGDVDGIVELLTGDARLTMPP